MATQQVYTLPEITVTASRDAITASRDAIPKGLVTSDDYHLSKLNIITNNNAKVDIKALFLEISYFEDIFRGATTGHILINDSNGFINAFRFTGQEKLELSFSKTTSTKNESITKTFRIIRVSERIRSNFNTETYSIHFCSEQLFISEQVKVSKSYSRMPISDIVNDVLKSYLGVPENKIFVENTDGVYDFVIPYKKPIETIEMLLNYARTSGDGKNVNYDFVFYEDKDLFNFVSLQSLYKRQAVKSFTFSAKNYLSPSNLLEIERSLSTIKAFSFLDTFDSLYGLSTGAFASRAITVDPLTMTYRKTDYSYDNYFNNSKHLNKYPVFNATDEILKNGNEAVLRVLTTNANQSKAKGIKEVYDTNPGAVASDTFAEARSIYRPAQIALALYTRAKITIAGNPSISVGDTINVEFPLIGENQKGGIDKYHSGKYLITAVRQIIDANMEYETVLEIAKDSVSTELTNINYTSTPEI